jgi:hypothetical protein
MIIPIYQRRVHSLGHYEHTTRREWQTAWRAMRILTQHVKASEVRWLNSIENKACLILIERRSPGHLSMGVKGRKYMRDMVRELLAENNNA